MATVEAELPFRVSILERDSDRNAAFRHKVAGEISTIGATVAVIHANVENQKEQLDDLDADLRSYINRATTTADTKSKQRFNFVMTLVAAVVGPIVGGIVTLILLGGTGG